MHPDLACEHQVEHQRGFHARAVQVLVALLGVLGVEFHMLVGAAALDRALSLAVVQRQILEQGHQPRAEWAAVRTVKFLQHVALDHLEEQILRKIFRVFDRKAKLACQGMNGRVIHPAETLHCHLALTHVIRLHFLNQGHGRGRKQMRRFCHGCGMGDSAGHDVP